MNISKIVQTKTPRHGISLSNSARPSFANVTPIKSYVMLSSKHVLQVKTMSLLPTCHINKCTHKQHPGAATPTRPQIWLDHLQSSSQTPKQHFFSINLLETPTTKPWQKNISLLNHNQNSWTYILLTYLWWFSMSFTPSERQSSNAQSSWSISGGLWEEWPATDGYHNLHGIVSNRSG